MIAGLAWAVIGVALVAGLGTVGLALADRRPLTLIAYGLAAVELAALVQVAAALVQLARGERPVEPAVFTGYALTSLLVPPAGALWALSEKTKWGTAAAGISSLVLAVLTVRMRQVWG